MQRLFIICKQLVEKKLKIFLYGLQKYIYTRYLPGM